MAIQIKSAKELELMRESGLVSADILEAMCQAARPGVSTLELDEIARKRIKQANVTPAFLGYGFPAFPAVICSSINEVIVHGIPRRDEVLKDGDIIGIDFGIFKNGFCTDNARTVLVGKVSPEARKLVEVTQNCLQSAIEICVAGNRLGDIGHTVESLAEAHSYGIVRDFFGHGIGRRMHEEPSVPNFGSAGEGKRLKRGLVIAIEPMVNAGTPEIEVLADKWTAVTRDRKLSAHFEHTIAITEEGPWVLTRIDSRPGYVGTPEPISYS